MIGIIVIQAGHTQKRTFTLKRKDGSPLDLTYVEVKANFGYFKPDGTTIKLAELPFVVENASQGRITVTFPGDVTTGLSTKELYALDFLLIFPDGTNYSRPSPPIKVILRSGVGLS